jgi:hypothetical protein
MRRLVLYSITLLLLIGITVQQRDTTASAPQSAYGCGVELSYQPYDRSVALVESVNSTMAIAIVESDFTPPFFSSLGKSPDCRYIAASFGASYAHNSTVIWDLATMQRVGVFPDAVGHPHRLTWSPDGTIAIIHADDGDYAWTLATDARTHVSNMP